MTRREKEKKQKESQKERVTERRTVTFVMGAVFGDAGASPFVAGALLLKEVLLEHEMLYFLKTQYTMPEGQTFRTGGCVLFVVLDCRASGVKAFGVKEVTFQGL